MQKVKKINTESLTALYFASQFPIESSSLKYLFMKKMVQTSSDVTRVDNGLYLVILGSPLSQILMSFLKHYKHKEAITCNKIVIQEVGIPAGSKQSHISLDTREQKVVFNLREVEGMHDSAVILNFQGMNAPVFTNKSYGIILSAALGALTIPSSDHYEKTHKIIAKSIYVIFYFNPTPEIIASIAEEACAASKFDANALGKTFEELTKPNDDTSSFASQFA